MLSYTAFFVGKIKYDIHMYSWQNVIYIMFSDDIVFILQLEITEFIPTLLYFGYTFLMVVTFWILTGTIGFYAAYFFIRKIYGAIKID